MVTRQREDRSKCGGCFLRRLRPVKTICSTDHPRQGGRQGITRRVGPSAAPCRAFLWTLRCGTHPCACAASKAWAHSIAKCAAARIASSEFVFAKFLTVVAISGHFWAHSFRWISCEIQRKLWLSWFPLKTHSRDSPAQGEGVTLQQLLYSVTIHTVLPYCHRVMLLSQSTCWLHLSMGPPFSISRRV